MSLKIPQEFQHVAHAVAINEHREGFAVRSIYSNATRAQQINGKGFSGNKRRIEKGFMGAHSDIGGGYSEGDLSDTALMWIINEAKKAGVKFNDAYINKAGFNKVTEPTIHDSVGVKVAAKLLAFVPGREFRWADDSTKGVSQFKKINHLGLAWKDTEEFENSRGGSKFKKVYNYTRGYQKCAAIGVCGPWVVRLKPMSDYWELKSGAYDDQEVYQKDNRVVLYNAKNANELINLKKYEARLKQLGY